jgi:hypothetical protein
MDLQLENYLAAQLIVYLEKEMAVLKDFLLVV